MQTIVYKVIFKTSNVKKMNNMFQACYALKSFNTSKFNTSKVTTMISMFNGCSSLTNIDLTNFDTTNVSTFGSMFSNCQAINTFITIRSEICDQYTLMFNKAATEENAEIIVNYT